MCVQVGSFFFFIGFLFCQSCLPRFFLPILEVGFQLNKEETTDSVEGGDRSDDDAACGSGFERPLP